jgi:hypothetical protein
MIPNPELPVAIEDRRMISGVISSISKAWEILRMKLTKCGDDDVL